MTQEKLLTKLPMIQATTLTIPQMEFTEVLLATFQKFTNKMVTTTTVIQTTNAALKLELLIHLGMKSLILSKSVWRNGPLSSLNPMMAFAQTLATKMDMRALQDSTDSFG